MYWNNVDFFKISGKIPHETKFSDTMDRGAMIAEWESFIIQTDKSSWPYNLSISSSWLILSKSSSLKIISLRLNVEI